MYHRRVLLQRDEDEIGADRAAEVGSKDVKEGSLTEYDVAPVDEGWSIRIMHNDADGAHNLLRVVGLGDTLRESQYLKIGTTTGDSP